MRILYCVHRYPPLIGGSEEVSRRIVQHLARHGHSVTVATGPRPSLGEANHGVEVHSFGMKTGAIWPGLPSHEREEGLRYRALFDEEWDIRFIYAAQTWTLNTVWDLIGQSGSADVLAPCGYSRLNDLTARDYFALIEELLPRFRYVVYHSAKYQDYDFAEERGLLGNAVVIPIGADVVAEHQLRVNRTSVRPLLCTVSSHIRSKGHSDFFAVCRSLDLPGLLVAPRPWTMREKLRGCYLQCQFSARLLRSVELVEGTDRERVDASLRQADLFFFPTSIENAPLVILEAMAQGVPWVSYNAGIVETLPGGVVVQDKFEALQVIHELATNPGRRQELARDGRSAIEERLSWDRILPTYQQLIESAY